MHIHYAHIPVIYILYIRVRGIELHICGCSFPLVHAGGGADLSEYVRVLGSRLVHHGAELAVGVGQQLAGMCELQRLTFLQLRGG